MENVFSELFKDNLFGDVYLTRVCEMRLNDRNLHSGVNKHRNKYLEREQDKACELQP